MKKNYILFLAGAMLFGFGISGIAAAASPSVYISPSDAIRQAGEDFDVAVGLNPAGEKICVVKGKIILKQLSCHEVKIGEGISVKDKPDCGNISFVFGIQGCATDQDKNLLTIKVRGQESGNAAVELAEVEAIGTASLIEPVLFGGAFKIEQPSPSCSCGEWGEWQVGGCGAENCAANQRQETRNRNCVPAGCVSESESRCKEHINCQVQANSQENVLQPEAEPANLSISAEENPAPINENFPPAPTVENEKNAAPEGNSLLASFATALWQISHSALLMILAILCLVVLAVIGVREFKFIKEKTKKQ